MRPVQAAFAPTRFGFSRSVRTFGIYVTCALNDFCNLDGGSVNDIAAAVQWRGQCVPKHPVVQVG